MAENPTSPPLPSSNFQGGGRRSTAPPSFSDTPPSQDSVFVPRRPLTSMTKERGEGNGGVASLVEETAGVGDLPASPVAEAPLLESLVEETAGIWDLPASPAAEAPPLESFVEETAGIWDVDASSFANSPPLESFVEETPGICDFVEETPGIWETESRRVVKKRKKAAGQTSGSAAGKENGMDLVEAAKIRGWDGSMNVTVLEILQLLVPAFFRLPPVRSFL